MSRIGHHTEQDESTGSNLSDAARQAGEITDRLVDDVKEKTAATLESLKPRLRGWFHVCTAPLALAYAVVLILLAPSDAARIAAVIFGLTTTVLFTTSGIYHRGTWSPRVGNTLRRIDHSNIFLVIAGTYTPLAVLLLDHPQSTILLSIVWGGALVGIGMRVFWLDAPRWLYVPIYIALGWVAVAYLPQLWASGGPAVVWLVIAGGLGYTLGAVAYGTKWPNPSPRWFGFHEIFHIGTLIGYSCHAVAVGIAMWG